MFETIVLRGRHSILFIQNEHVRPLSPVRNLQKYERCLTKSEREGPLARRWPRLEDNIKTDLKKFYCLRLWLDLYGWVPVVYSCKHGTSH